MTPHAYLLDSRIQRARQWLREGYGLADLAYRLGFSDQSHFQHAFRERVAVTPGEYQRGIGTA
jgi:AraC-like DNA-binding protein